MAGGRISGTLRGWSGSDPSATSSPSGYPSPSVSGLKGSVPSSRSWSSERPSPSLSITFVTRPVLAPVVVVGVLAVDFGGCAIPEVAVFWTEKTTLSASFICDCPPPELRTEKVMLSASKNCSEGRAVLRTENMALSASKKPDAGTASLIAETVRLSTSPESRQLRGVQAALSGSEPVATSTPSEKPSPSVSGLKGSVPRIPSWASLSPSPSESTEGDDGTTVKVLAIVGTVLELPEGVVATNIN